MIPLDLRNGKVMLAAQSKTVASTPTKAVEMLHQAGDYIFETKWDGIRALLFVENGEVTLVGRSGRDETVRYPELVEALSWLPDGTVLDGELLVFRNGTPVFNLVQQRNSQSNPEKITAKARLLPATFMAFDCLMVNSVDLRGRALETRRIMLDNVVTTESDHIRKSPYSHDGLAMWDFAREHNLEGLIAKPFNSVYRATRSGGWVKVKTCQRMSVLVIGYDPGKGKRNGMVGAVKLGLFNGEVRADNIVEVGEAGTGFTDAEATEIRQQIDHYAKAVTEAAAEGVMPPMPLIAEVEYLEVTKDRRLRFPVWLGLRHDVTWSDCTIDAQIGA